MDDVSIKSIVLALLRQAHQDEQTMAAELTDAERAGAGTPERQSVKDMIAHMAAWKQRHAQKLATALRGEVPPKWTDVALIDQLNAETVAAYGRRSWQEVLGAAEQAFDALYSQVERMTEAELTDPNRYAWQEGAPLWQETLGNGLWHPYTHLVEHYRQRGDVARAAGLYEALGQTLAEMRAPPKMRGNALYNLACIYATAGQTGKAMAALPEALRLNPKLVEWSQKDHDLELLWAEPAFLALVAG